MIVISGALVLVALVLLIFGITTTDLDFVYASIVVSLVSFVFLLIGILQRRGDRRSDAAPASAQAKDEPAPAKDKPVDEDVTAVVPRARTSARGSAPVQEPVDEPETEEIDLAEDEELLDGIVLVVPGRPRYHVDGCRYLTGKAATEVDVLDARDEGFSPCGVCKPDDVLATEIVVEEEPVDDTYVDDADDDEPVDEAYDDEPYEEEPVDEAYEDPAAAQPVAEEDVVLEDVPGAEELEPVAAAPARRSRSTTAAKKAPAKRAPRAARGSRSEPSPAAVAASAEPASDAVLEAVASDAPAAAPAAADGAAAPAKGSRRTGNVVVIPDRGKFHRAECRYVRNADGTSTISRTAASKQGYDACGVCKP